MNDNWKQIIFGDLYSISSRNGLSKPSIIRGAGTKFINMGELFAYDKFINVPTERVPMTEKEVETSLLEEGDLLFARQSLVLSGAGKCSIFISDMENVTFESHLIRVRLKKELIYPLFYYYLFRSPYGRGLIYTITEQGAGQSGIRGSDLSKIKVHFPPLPEQKSIAHILGTLDDKIELNRQMNQTLEAMAQALFKSWFVDFDPVMDNALESGREIPEELQDMAEKRQLVPDSKKLLHTNPSLAAQFPSAFEFNEVLGKWVPEGWEVIKLKSIGSTIRDNKSPQDISENDIYIGLEHIGRKQIFLLQYGYGDEISSNKSSFNKGDILFGKLRPYFHKVCIAPTKGICSTDILVFRAKKEEYKSFLAMILFQEELVEYANMRATGTRMPRANQKDIQDFDLVFPPFELLKKYNNQASFLFSKGLQSVNETETLTQLRDRLLPELISGRVRVPMDLKNNF
jgi:type I restriction enzyme S subunit